MDRPKRTERQNRAMHLLMTQIASELNDSGLYMQKVLKHDADIEWTSVAVKEYLLRPFMRAMYNIESTTELDTKQIGDAMDAMLHHLAKVTGLAFEIPSQETKDKL